MITIKRNQGILEFFALVVVTILRPRTIRSRR
jgi:hypothetical protein